MAPRQWSPTRTDMFPTGGFSDHLSSHLAPACQHWPENTAVPNAAFTQCHQNGKNREISWESPFVVSSIQSGASRQCVAAFNWHESIVSVLIFAIYFNPTASFCSLVSLLQVPFHHAWDVFAVRHYWCLRLRDTTQRLMQVFFPLTWFLINTVWMTWREHGTVRLAQLWILTLTLSC